MKRKVVRMQNEKREKGATVNIDNPEIVELIKKLVVLTVEQNIRATDVSKKIAEERQAYLESKNVLPVESLEEMAFRERAKIFLYDRVYNHISMEWKTYEQERVEFHVLNAIEIACAGYKLYKDLEDIRINSLYQKAQQRMPSKPSYAANRTWGSKHDFVQKFMRDYFPEIIAEELHKDENLAKNCNKFLEQYEYRKGVEETMLQLIYLINNNE